MTAKKTTEDAALVDNAPEGMALSDAQKAEQRAEGAKEAVKEAAKQTYTALTDGNLPGDVTTSRWTGHDEIQMFAHWLDQPADVILKAHKDGAIPDNKLYGLLALERNGQNRTEYVKPIMKRLGLKADELPGGGPSYTNDTTNLSAL